MMGQGRGENAVKARWVGVDLRNFRSEDLALESSWVAEKDRSGKGRGGERRSNCVSYRGKTIRQGGNV